MHKHALKLNIWSKKCGSQTKHNYEWFQKHENSPHCEYIAKTPINQQRKIELNKHSSFSNPLAQFKIVLTTKDHTIYEI
jgi:galactose-1-phosphate uridylyltransferase